MTTMLRSRNSTRQSAVPDEIAPAVHPGIESPARMLGLGSATFAGSSSLPHPLRDRLGPFLTEPTDRNGSAFVRERVSQGLTEAPAWNFGSGGWGSTRRLCGEGHRPR